jgi:hypothetical protein
MDLRADDMRLDPGKMGDREFEFQGADLFRRDIPCRLILALEARRSSVRGYFGPLGRHAIAPRPKDQPAFGVIKEALIVLRNAQGSGQTTSSGLPLAGVS